MAINDVRLNKDQFLQLINCESLNVDFRKGPNAFVGSFFFGEKKSLLFTWNLDALKSGKKFEVVRSTGDKGEMQFFLVTEDCRIWKTDKVPFSGGEVHTITIKKGSS